MGEGRAVVVGAGAVGARVARQLLGGDGIDELVVVEPTAARARSVATSLGAPARTGEWADAVRGAALVVLAAPGPHRRQAEEALEHGASVVSVGDAVPVVQSLLELDAEARERGRSVVVGAGFSPGLTCVLARHAAAGFSQVDEVHVAKVGTGGPSCARQRHRAMGGEAVDLRDGAWVRRRGGSGRELCWFPDPVGAVDCYRAALPEAILLAPAFAGVQRVTGRVSASRRDRLTSRLPMLRPPHPEGRTGAVRVEVRGWRGEGRNVHVLGAIDRPAVAAGTVAAVAGLFALAGRLAPGAGGLAALVEPLPFLTELARRGVRAAVFEGAAHEPTG